MREIKELVSRYWETIQQHRRYFHQHPEPSHQEKNTAAYIAKALREMGLEPRENVGGYGVTAVIEGKGEGKCVALRADFDALEMTEQTGVPFASETPGVMHACGHDLHAAMLLGAACVLNDLRDSFCGKVKLIFQPSEEDAAGSGAKAMIEDGCLENPHVDAVFGQHVWPDLPLGTIGVKQGFMMGASDRFFITVRGKAGHGGKPQEGVDAIVIASQIVTALQTIVARNVGPVESGVISIGKIRGGSRYNIIADEVKMEGTCRTGQPEVQELIPKRMEAIIKGIAESMGGSGELDYRMGSAPCSNSPEMFRYIRESAAEVCGADGVMIPEKGVLLSEDFSHYGKYTEAGFCWLGCGDGTCTPLHTTTFLPQEATMAVGTEFLVTAALRYLATER